MLRRIDRHIIALHDKHKNRRTNRFFATATGFVLSTLFALYKDIMEIADSVEEGHYVLACIFTGIAVVLVFFLFRHAIWHRRIEHFEYRLKLAEAAIIFYIGFDRCCHFASQTGYFSFRPVFLTITTIGIVLLYCLQARLFYLKSTNVISDAHPVKKKA